MDPTQRSVIHTGHNWGVDLRGECSSISLAVSVRFVLNLAVSFRFVSYDCLIVPFRFDSFLSFPLRFSSFLINNLFVAGRLGETKADIRFQPVFNSGLTGLWRFVEF